MLTVQHTNLFGLGALPTIPSVPSSITDFPSNVLTAMREDMFQPIGSSFARLGDGMRKFGTGFLVIMAMGITGWLAIRVWMGRPQLYFINESSAR